ncbi:MAG: helix-turn-helix domain-containing protein [Gemmatimonadetes bacterium]|nr:helix-turn-helix domain-containing protein [Gemmatimonadota bacterium]
MARGHSRRCRGYEPSALSRPGNDPAPPRAGSRRGHPAVVSRRQLLESVWRVTASITTRTVDMHVRRAKSGAAADWIETVRGFGYRLRKGPQG